MFASIKGISTALVVLTTVGAAGSALAAPPRVHVMNRQMHERARIREGVRSGQLTRGEQRRLNRQQRRIQNTKRFMLRDGRLGPRERAKLNRMQNRASRNIFRAKHNLRVRR